MDTDASHPPDFFITKGNVTLPVHRNVLKESSYYFTCMFECGIQEAQTGTLVVKNTTPSVVRTMISYVYGDEISIEWDDVMEYMDIIEKWQLQKLKDELEDYIITNVDVRNSVSWFFISQKYNMPKLEQKNHRMIDAPTKLEISINTILEDATMTMGEGVDLLQHKELAECSTKFMELVLKIYKRTLSDDKLRDVEHYLSMLSFFCIGNHLGMPNDIDTESDMLMEIERGVWRVNNNQTRMEMSTCQHSILAIGKRRGEKMIVRLDTDKILSKMSVAFKTAAV